MLVGVATIQGDFEKHIEALEAVGVSRSSIVGVKTPDHLKEIDRLIIPGGESTTVSKLMAFTGLDEAIKVRAAEGMPVWGTCMGMIMMARDIEGSEQQTLGLIDITVRRNAFGAQVHSFEQEIDVAGLDEPVNGVFIRAPEITRLGEGVECIAECRGKAVAARCGRLIGTSFHPELTDDRRLHELFLSL
jgi:5'-phosphate synthase pdxT subunit